MSVSIMQGAPEQAMQQALAAFERQFIYPLGATQSFRVMHDLDYPRFCRTMGDGCCFVYEERGLVLGTLAASIRPIQRPDGAEDTIAYICDIKVAPTQKRGFVLLKLMLAALGWCKTRTSSGFGVVMDGTAAVPTAYTGRLGIPPFRALGKIMVLRILAEHEIDDAKKDIWSSNENDVRRTLSSLSRGSYLCPPGLPAVRSQMPPQWLLSGTGEACGCLEDTGLAKQLVTTAGVPMKSAHLSSFAYRDQSQGAKLIRHALSLAREQGYPAMFVAVPLVEAELMSKELFGLEVAHAPATIFGFGLKAADRWMINTSEI